MKQWIDHLYTIRKNRIPGAAKAAETSRSKKATVESVYYCGVCKTPYQEFTVTVEQWIGCDKCDAWFHAVCVGINNIPENFECNKCSTF